MGYRDDRAEDVLCNVPYASRSVKFKENIALFALLILREHRRRRRRPPADNYVRGNNSVRLNSTTGVAIATAFYFGETIGTPPPLSLRGLVL